MFRSYFAHTPRQRRLRARRSVVRRAVSDLNASTPAEAGREWREVGALVRYVPLVFRSYSSATTSPRAPLCGPSSVFIVLGREKAPAREVAPLPFPCLKGSF